MKELTIKDLRRDIEQAKKRLSTKKITENFGESEIRKLKDKYFDLSMYDRSAYHNAMSAFEDWCYTYTGVKSSRKVVYPKNYVKAFYYGSSKMPKYCDSISRKSKNGIVPLYYDVAKNAVYDKDGDGRFYLTDLIRFNTPEEVAETVRYFMSL